MEFATIELREAAAEPKDHIVDLNELELALVGGGTGDVVFG